MPRSPRILSAAANSSSSLSAPPPEAVTVESDFVVILAALLCALICVVGLIAVARCAWLRRTNGGATHPPLSLISTNRGLKKKILRSLPKFTYTEGSAAASPTKFAAECAICLGEFAEGDEIRMLPQCGHVFHVGCIDTWLGSHPSCPSCRRILVVVRCQKCGQLPAIGGGGGDGIDEAELKAREDNGGNSNNNDNSFLP